MNDLENQILKSAVKNFQTFGYDGADEDNIFIDEVYSLFFERMLKENLGQGQTYDNAIENILKKLKSEK